MKNAKMNLIRHLYWIMILKPIWDVKTLFNKVEKLNYLKEDG